jgi:hypothetical protein
MGDLIYSLYMVKKMGGGKFAVGIENLENILATYNYHSQHVSPLHKGRFNINDFELIAPLLAEQEYITEVSKWYAGDADPNVDLDSFRGVLYRTFEGNIIEAYHHTFNLPFTEADQQTPWLTVKNPNRVKSVVVTRSERYNPRDSIERWQPLIETGMFNDEAIFVGLPQEHEAFNRTFGTNVSYYPVNNLLELAEVIAGADLVVSNQGMTYSIATGLGKDTLVQLDDVKPVYLCECYFKRNGAQYF